MREKKLIKVILVGIFQPDNAATTLAKTLTTASVE